MGGNHGGYGGNFTSGKTLSGKQVCRKKESNMIKRKYGAANVTNGTSVTIVTLTGIAGKSRKVKAVYPELADKLRCQVWLNQEKIQEYNTAQACVHYGSATVFDCHSVVDVDIAQGDELSVIYYNGTGGDLTAAEAVIEFDEK